jgi:hypothetical protein
LKLWHAEVFIAIKNRLSRFIIVDKKTRRMESTSMAKIYVELGIVSLMGLT